MKIGIRKRYFIIMGALRRVCAEHPSAAKAMHRAIHAMAADGRITPGSARLLAASLPSPPARKKRKSAPKKAAKGTKPEKKGAKKAVKKKAKSPQK